MQAWGGNKVNGEEIFPRLKAAFAQREDLAEDDLEGARQMISSYAQGSGKR